MGVYLSYFIEYKKRKDDKWRLVSMLVPTEKHCYPEYHEKKTIDGVEHCLSLVADKQGYIRDVFSSRGWYDAPFTGRGFPEDMSAELKEYLERCKISEFEEQKKNTDPDFEYKIVGGIYTKVPRTEPLSIEKDYVDYRYDKTYATLTELSAFQVKQVMEAKKRIEEEQDKDKYTKLNERIDELQELILTGKKPQLKEPSENDEDNYDVMPELEEELDDATFLGEWIYGINAIVDFYNGGWNDYEDIRVIAYLS